MSKPHAAKTEKRAEGGTIGGGHTAGWCSGSTPASTTGERRIVTAGLPPRARSAWAPHGHSASFSTGHARSAAVRRDRAADVASRSWAGEAPARGRFLGAAKRAAFRTAPCLARQQKRRLPGELTEDQTAGTDRPARLGSRAVIWPLAGAGAGAAARGKPLHPLSSFFGDMPGRQISSRAQHPGRGSSGAPPGNRRGETKRR